MMKSAARWIVPLLALLITRPFMAQTIAPPPVMSDMSPVRLLRTLPLPGNGPDSFALDPVERRLFLPGDDSLHVFFLDTLSPDGNIAYPGDVRRLIFMPELGRAMISTRMDSALTFLDLKTLAPVDPPIPLGEGYFHFCYDPAAKRVFAFNTGPWISPGKEVTVLDARSGKVLGTISLGGFPGAVVSDGQGEMFVRIIHADTEVREMVVIDTRTLAVLHRWTMPPTSASSSLVMDTVHRRLFAVTQDGTLIMMNADTGEIIISLLLPGGQGACFFDALGQRVVIASSRGTLTWVHEDTPDTLTVQAVVTVHGLVVWSAFDPVSPNLFVLTA